ncbi:hypothetical protein ACFL0D_03905 [Thermoproteota archaeon]
MIKSDNVDTSSFVRALKERDSTIQDLINNVNKLNNKLNSIKKDEAQERRIKKILEKIYNSEYCESEIQLKDGKIYLIIKAFYPLFYPIIENICFNLDTDDWEQLRKRLFLNSPDLSIYFNLLDRMKTWQHNMKFYARNHVIDYAFFTR